MDLRASQTRKGKGHPMEIQRQGWQRRESEQGKQNGMAVREFRRIISATAGLLFRLHGPGGIPRGPTRHSNNAPVVLLELDLVPGQGIGPRGQIPRLRIVALFHAHARQAIPQIGLLGLDAKGPLQGRRGPHIVTRLALLLGLL